MIMTNTKVLLISLLFLILPQFIYQGNAQTTENNNTESNDKKPSSAISSEESVYSPGQDSAYFKAKDLDIPAGIRLWYDLLLSNRSWELNRESYANSPWQTALRNMEVIPPEAFMPGDIEIVSHKMNILNSQYVPFVNTMPNYGLKVPFSTIASFLGLTEDVSPKIRYTIDFKADIEVVIYSIQAKVIATLFKGKQQPGSYTLHWNGRDDNGKPMPAGDYIAEVRINNENYLRKRIIIK